MTPGARIQAATELLDALDRQPLDGGSLPADALLNSYFRSRRYIGAKDRRAIGDAVFQTLRQRGYVDWWLTRWAGLPVENRFRALWTFGTHQDLGVDAIIAACDGRGHNPPALTEDQRRRVALLGQGQSDSPETLADQASFPAALAAEIERQFGAEAWAEMIAFTQPAPTDLRVNTLRTTRDRTASALAKAGVATAPTPYSPLGLRLDGRVNLAQLRAYRDGWIEVQDESSQLAALLSDARPGMHVLDVCAGAGGKTLALAAAMKNRGRILAHDRSAKRLARMKPRLARAGVRIAETTSDTISGAGQFDRVLVDAPCSGSGTWRRRPETKWRLTADSLNGFHVRQRELLSQAARHTKPGGRLLYASCSILPAEGRDVVAAFLAAQATAFRLLQAEQVWRDAVGSDPPFAGPHMLLTPHRHATDGFFLAILERVR